MGLTSYSASLSSLRRLTEPFIKASYAACSFRLERSGQRGLWLRMFESANTAVIDSVTDSMPEKLCNIDQTLLCTCRTPGSSIPEEPVRSSPAAMHFAQMNADPYNQMNGNGMRPHSSHPIFPNGQYPPQQIEYRFRNIIFPLISSDLFTTGKDTKVEQLPWRERKNPISTIVVTQQTLSTY